MGSRTIGAALAAWLLALTGAAPVAQAQDRPGVSPRAPHPTKAAPAPVRAIPRTSSPDGGVPAHLTPPPPRSAPACEQDLWKAARERGRLGAMVQDAKPHGIQVLDVLPETPAAREGLLPGDRIVGTRSLPSR
ncbi:MAG: PDZ domain-containing protein [Myxococcota bacterium]